MAQQQISTHPIVDASGSEIMLAEDGQVIKAPDPVVEATKKNWSDIGYLYECFENFLKAIQMKAKKDYHFKSQGGKSKEQVYAEAGSPVWNVKDDFFSWMKDNEGQLIFRLAELERKKKDRVIGDKHLLHLLDSGAIENPHPFLAKEMTIEDAEMFEFVIRKSLEATEKFRKGTYSMDDVRRGQHRAT